MASIELHVSIYPTVWHVVIKDSGLPPGQELVDSVWATENLAELAAYKANKRDEKLGVIWEVTQQAVGIQIKD